MPLLSYYHKKRRSATLFPLWLFPVHGIRGIVRGHNEHTHTHSLSLNLVAINLEENHAEARKEAKDKESQVKIADLGQRLNVALAKKVQELARYRSDFFGRLREILSDRENIRIVGDRFVFQSEVLFPIGGNELDAAGLVEMDKLAAALLDLAKEIPAEINWVLRVDGHTDNAPLSGTGRYRDNWELSSARATSVVKYLISKGVPANRLVAAGFGEFQPIAAGDTPDARNQNRRIELKLTER